MALQRWDGQEDATLSAPPAVAFSGRVLVAVAPFAMAASPCIEGSAGSYALCSSQVRASALVGDVVVIVSPPRSCASTRGLQCTQRVVLSVGLVELLMPVARYHSLGAPGWTRDRRDAVYRAKPLEVDGAAVAPRERAQTMRTLELQRLRLKPRHCRSEGPRQWRIDYGNAIVRFQLKSRTRWHTSSGVNRVKANTRWRDFSGNVLLTGLCRSFPSSGPGLEPLPAALRRLRLGVGFRIARAPRNGLLRRWLRAKLGQEL